jgi:Ca2+-binding EF-hand superfamily protein
MKLALLPILASVLLTASQAHAERDARSREAMATGFAKMLHNWDKDGDGKISANELVIMIGDAFPSKYYASEADAQSVREGALADYKDQDLDKDGFLTLSELLKEPMATFDCIDVNHDGVLQQDEIDSGVSRCGSDAPEARPLHDIGISNSVLGQPEIPFGPAKALNEGDWLHASDFRGPEFRNHPHGAVHLVLHISAQGRVTRCTTQASSGDVHVDDYICNLIIDRARFRPAGDPRKHAVEGTHSRQFAW